MFFTLLAWLIMMRKLTMMHKPRFLQIMTTLALLFNVHVYYTIVIVISILMYTGNIDTIEKVIMHTSNIKKECLEHLSATGRSLFEIRSGFNNSRDYTKMQHYGVHPVEKLSSDISRGSSRLRNILSECSFPTVYENILELGVGAGGWLQSITDQFEFENYVGYSRWNQPGQENLKFLTDDPRIHFRAKNIEQIHGSNLDKYEKLSLFNTTLLLSDFGENVKVSSRRYSYDEVHGLYLDDVETTLAVMAKLNKFIVVKPEHFIIRIPNVINDKVVEQLEEWQNLLGKGSLYRCPDERNNVDVAYFVSTEKKNLRTQVNDIANTLLHRMELCLLTPDSHFPQLSGLEVFGYAPKWTKVQELPVPKLVPYDMSETIRSKGKVRAPIHTTKFLREVGWWPSKFVGSQGTRFNPIFTYFISRLRDVMDDFNAWETTSTKAKDTYAIVMKKVDVEPKENHEYHNHLWGAYRGLSKYIRSQKLNLSKQSEEEIGENLNRNGAMGDQDCHMPYRNLGEYYDSNTWQEQVAAYKESLRKGRPEKADFNTIGKKERKKTKSSRLIWFQRATARLYEAQVLGNIDNIVKKLPYSISGIPLYDYGETLARILVNGRKAVADDVAGWDTKVSYAMLCMECEFLKSLTDDEEHKKEIERIYRVYAFPLVNITRDIDGKVQNVLYQLRGQVASGRRVTYSMNTITNTVVTMTRAAVSQSIPESEIEDWVFKRLSEGHTDKYGGKISGDDSVIIMSPDNIKLFATEGAKFMNAIGMPRKNLGDSQPSIIKSNLYDIEFCSHAYTQVEYKGVTRWMATRPVTEILAKATIFMGNFNTREQQAAWARANALNLLVNYFHMPTIRRVALGVLDSTPINISLDDVTAGWSYRARPWIDQGRTLDVINNCYMNNSAFPLPRIDSLQELPKARPYQMRDFEIRHSTNPYRKWLWEFPKYVRAVRQSGYADWKYDDVGTFSLSVDLTSSFSKPFNWGGRA